MQTSASFPSPKVALTFFALCYKYLIQCLVIIQAINHLLIRKHYHSSENAKLYKQWKQHSTWEKQLVDWALTQTLNDRQGQWQQMLWFDTVHSDSTVSASEANAGFLIHKHTATLSSISEADFRKEKKHCFHVSWYFCKHEKSLFMLLVKLLLLFNLFHLLFVFQCFPNLLATHCVV